MCIYVYIYIYVCMYVYIYIYINIGCNILNCNTHRYNTTYYTMN